MFCFCLFFLHRFLSSCVSRCFFCIFYNTCTSKLQSYLLTWENFGPLYSKIGFYVPFVAFILSVDTLKKFDGPAFTFWMKTPPNRNYEGTQRKTYVPIHIYICDTVYAHFWTHRCTNQFKHSLERFGVHLVCLFT